MVEAVRHTDIVAPPQTEDTPERDVYSDTMNAAADMLNSHELTEVQKAILNIALTSTLFPSKTNEIGEHYSLAKEQVSGFARLVSKDERLTAIYRDIIGTLRPDWQEPGNFTSKSRFQPTYDDILLEDIKAPRRQGPKGGTERNVLRAAREHARRYPLMPFSEVYVGNLLNVTRQRVHQIVKNHKESGDFPQGLIILKRNGHRKNTV